MFKCGLSTIDFDGSRFTWTNGSVWQRLDRALGNRRWSEAYPLSRVSYMARGRSDHNPLLIRCAGYRVRSSCFRFLNVWHRHPQFREIVSDAWSEEVYGMEMVRFYNKLKTVRDKLKQWNCVVFGNVSSKVAEAEQELKQREVEHDLLRSEESKIHLHEARADTIGHFLWSVYFGIRRQVQALTELPFKVPRVPQEDNELMKRLPTMEEIHENFFQGMEQPKSWSHSMVVLIPKVEVTSHWQDFRPISLCNVSSKIVSKILAIRISKLLPKLISPWQTRFVPGRGIVDNVLKGAPGTSSVLSC
ncbi:uncharacterized protein [Coffea arabica]|uniref:Reverse transcriptase domain-containing protein n=1 Tax=Coffea arabica TaxID=13443 RepID=A0ABM4WMM2_COFAR